MEDLIENLLYVIIKKLVLHPDAVKVERELTDSGDLILYKVSVESLDMCRVIGRQGRIVKSIKSIARAAAIKNNLRIAVEIV